MNLDISSHQEGDFLVIDVRGEVDLYSAASLKEALYKAIDGGIRRLVVNMDGLEFMDSSGLGILVGALKRLSGEEGELRLVCNRDNILKIFRITGLDKVFPIHESVEASVAS